jgi:phosphoserine phosphatase
MSDILLLISGNNEKPLTSLDIAKLKNILNHHNISFGSENWLCPEKAIEINEIKNITIDIQRQISKTFHNNEIDVFSVSSLNRRKKLLLADMDATIVKGETLDDLAECAGIKNKIAPITERAMRGEIDFQAALIERVAMLENIPLSKLLETRDAIVINKGAQDVISVMRKFGAECYLVSGGFTFFTEDIAQKCGFNGHHGNKLDMIEGRLSGRVIPPILDKDSKLSFLNTYIKKLNINPAQSMAVGDGANDIPMLQGAGLGVGYHPKPLVQEKINNCIVHTDLTSLLYIQGYTWQDIAI